MLESSIKKPGTAIERNLPRTEGIPEEVMTVILQGSPAETGSIMNGRSLQREGNAVTAVIADAGTGITATIQSFLAQIMPVP